MNKNKEIIKALFGRIIDFITEDYNIIFDKERMELSIVDASEWGNEFICIDIAPDNSIRIFWRDEDYSFNDIEESVSFVRGRILINNFIMVMDNTTITEENFKKVTDVLNNF